MATASLLILGTLAWLLAIAAVVGYKIGHHDGWMRRSREFDADRERRREEFEKLMAEHKWRKT